MENTQNKKNSWFVPAAVLILVLALSLLVLNFLSGWKCVGGQWIRDGFPLSQKPQGGCEISRVAENSGGFPAGLDAKSEKKTEEEEFSGKDGVESEVGLEKQEEKTVPGKCGDPKDDPILGDCGEDCNTDNWKVYKNKKYGYSFRYPAGYALTNNCKGTACVSEQEGGDLVSLSGEHILGDWPVIDITHYSTEHYNPPAGTNQIDWIKKKFPWTEECFPDTANIYFTREEGHLFGGFNVYLPSSPQAHSRREIYYLYDGKLFKIMMLDVDSPQARQFYDIWMSTFSVIGES